MSLRMTETSCCCIISLSLGRHMILSTSVRKSRSRDCDRSTSRDCVNDPEYASMWVWFVCMYVYKHIFVCVYICMYMYSVCVCVCVCVFWCVRASVCVQTHVAHAHIGSHIQGLKLDLRKITNLSANQALGTASSVHVCHAHAYTTLLPTHKTRIAHT
jgi:hypothetical protein